MFIFYFTAHAYILKSLSHKKTQNFGLLAVPSTSWFRHHAYNIYKAKQGIALPTLDLALLGRSFFLNWGFWKHISHFQTKLKIFSFLFLPF